MNPESNLAAETAPVVDETWNPSPEDDAGWVGIRCNAEVVDRTSQEKKVCGKLIFRIMAEPTVDGLKRVVKLCLDMKCRRCKAINYRIIVI